MAVSERTIDADTGEVRTVVVREALSLDIGQVEFTRVGLRIGDALTLEQAGNLCEFVGRAQDASQFWVGDVANAIEFQWGQAYDDLIARTGQKYQTVANQKWVAASVPFSLRREKLKWNHHEVVAPLEPTEQAHWLDLAEANGWSYRELREAIRGRPQEPVPPPPGTYSLIYADPPWRYEFSETESREIENQYPTMDLDAIKLIPVATWTAPDAMLFLWATSPKLEEAMSVLTAWGFGYRTCMVWVKDKIGMGYYARQQHELLLIGRRGEPKVPEPGDRPPSVIVAPRTEHSAKPPEVYDLIERMYPGQKYLEMFARNRRDGWEPWGNQVPEGQS